MKKILLTILLFIGICLVLYPFMGRYFNKYKELRDISKYEQDKNEISQEQLQEMNIDYSKYNGIIGYIEIPIIELKLPIYPNTKEKNLLKGIGVFEETMIPNKDFFYHCILVGHTGITGKNLFDNIDKLQISNIFYIEILNEKYKYEICEIDKVLPNEVENLINKQNDKLVTLVTCTPKYINTHRLLVTGKEM